MMATTYENRVPAWFWVVAGLGLVWNAIGAAFYLGSVGVLGGPFAPPPGMPAMPDWATAAYAIGVGGSVVAMIGLLMRARWARLLLWVALAALIVDWAWVFFMSGAGIQPLGICVLLIALLLALRGELAMKRGWIR
jgi:hypothetical protein